MSRYTCPECGASFERHADWMGHCCYGPRVSQFAKDNNTYAALATLANLPEAVGPDSPANRTYNPQQALTGGKLAGDHYYRVTVPEPISPEVHPYTAECADIIEALGMTFNEGEAFKAIWRLAAARQGRGKPGNKPQYDADKAAHYGARIAAQAKRAAP